MMITRARIGHVLDEMGLSVLRLDRTMEDFPGLFLLILGQFPYAVQARRPPVSGITTACTDWRSRRVSGRVVR